MICGEGVAKWAKDHNSCLVFDSETEYLNTMRNAKNTETFYKIDEFLGRNKSLHDTVGAIVLDQDGNLASGVSSGGILYKNVGRIGHVCETEEL